MKTDYLELLRSGADIPTRQQISLTLRLSWPAIMAQLATIAMQYIDAAMVGRLGSVQSAAVGLVASTTWLFGGLSYAAAMGFNVLTAQRVGGGEGIEAKIIVRLCGRLLALDGMKEDPVMTALIHRAFLSGKYDELLLNYLNLYFKGTVKEMRDVWSTAESFGVDTLAIEERILIQMLYTDAFVGNAAAIFQNYVKKGADPSVELAFLAQSCHDYFVKDKVTDPFILNEVERIWEEEQALPMVCKLAYTKFYAGHKEQTNEKVSRNLLIFLREMTAEKMVFPFYKEFAENITFMHKYMDKTMVEYHVHDGNRAVIHYLVEREGNVENEYRKEEMKNMYDGICVKEFVLFFGERLQYYIVELEDGKEQLNESGTFSRSDTDTNQKISRYNLINDIAMARTLKDYDTMESMLFEYYDYSYLLDELFSMK